MNEANLLNSEKYLKKIHQTERWERDLDVEESVKRMETPKTEAVVGKEGIIEFQIDQYSVHMEYSSIDEKSIEDVNNFIAARNAKTGDDKSSAANINNWRMIKSLQIKIDDTNEEIDFSRLLPKGYDLYFHHQDFHENGSIVWEQKKIYFIGNIVTPGMIITMLHEAGHAWDDVRLKKLGVERLVDEHIHSDKAEKIRRERAASAFAFKILRPYMDKQLRKDVLNYLKQDALKSYNDHVFDQLATHRAVTHGTWDEYEYSDDEMERDRLWEEFREWKMSEEYQEWKTLEEHKNLEDYEEFGVWCEWMEKKWREEDGSA